jgi:hypothetical protein
MLCARSIEEDEMRLSKLAMSTVIASALAVTGCGGSSSSPTVQPTEGSAAATPSGSHAPATRADARAAAAKVNLTAADMTGYTAKAHHESAKDKASSRQLDRCVGDTNGLRHELADVNSEDFSRGQGLASQEVSSDVTVEDSTAIVSHDLALINSPKALPCVKRFLLKAFTASAAQLTIKSVALTRIPTPAPEGASAAFGVRIKVIGSVQGHSFPFFFDIRGAAVATYELTFFDLGITKPYPTAQATHWLSLITQRAAALQ